MIPSSERPNVSSTVPGQTSLFGDSQCEVAHEPIPVEIEALPRGWQLRGVEWLPQSGGVWRLTVKARRGKVRSGTSDDVYDAFSAALRACNSYYSVPRSHMLDVVERFARRNGRDDLLARLPLPEATEDTR